MILILAINYGMLSKQSVENDTNKAYMQLKQLPNFVDKIYERTDIMENNMNFACLVAFWGNVMTSIEMQKNFDDELKKLLPNSIPHRIYLTIGKITLLASYIRTQIQTYVTELLVGKPQKKFAVY